MKITGVPSSTYDAGIERIISAVAAHFRLSIPVIVGECRSLPIAEARHMAMALIREHHGYTLKRIGRPFDRDHSTVSYGLRQAARRRADDPEYEAAYQAISVALTSMRDAA